MSIWNHEMSLESLNASNKGTMGEAIGLEFTAIGEDYLEATIPVDHRTKQPYGLLHGGASVTLAETLGSVAAMLALKIRRSRLPSVSKSMPIICGPSGKGRSRGG